MADGYRSQGPLCLILLTYEAPLHEVDAQMKAHVDWLEVGFDEGVFMIAGRRNPRTGGVILARGLTRPQLDEVLAEDPFYREQVAQYQVIEFAPTKFAPGLTSFLQPQP